MSPARRVLRRIVRERRIPVHIRRYARWRLFGEPQLSSTDPPAGSVKAAIDQRAAELLERFEQAGVLAFLVDQLGHRVELGLADEQQARARSVIETVAHDWSLSRDRVSMIIDPHWGGSGGAGIDLSFWQSNDRGERERVGVRGADRIPVDPDYVRVSLGGHQVLARPSYVAESMRLRPRFPIDVVISWVDDRDEAWRSRMQHARQDSSVTPQNSGPARSRSNDELRFLLRSIDRFAPFVRKIFIVTDCQPPPWLDTSLGAIEIVDQTELLGGDPVFNSLAVEAALHWIDGLSEHFIYFNDDMFIARPIEPELFFSAAGHMRLTVGPRIRAGGPLDDDIAFESAAKVARRLVSDHLGWTPEHNTNHVPLPQRRSVATRGEERFNHEVTATRTSTFRDPTNTTTATGLFHYLGQDLGLVSRSTMKWEYIDTADVLAASKYADLLRGHDVDVFCCNDTSSSLTVQNQQSLVTFLERYFPGPSRFELP